MALHGKMLIAWAVSLLVLTLAAAEVHALGRGLDDPQCGRQAGGRRCPNDLCCSQFGFCGDIDEYCKNGCQSQCRSQVRALGRGLDDPQCGRQAGGRRCPNDLCCSQFGFCGETDEYCKNGCQSQCRSQVRALGRGLDDPQCGRQAGGRRCPNDLCCSQFGFCGDTDEYCKNGCQSQCRSQVRALGRGLDDPQCGRQAGGRRCPNDLCCSQFGFCGDTDEYCKNGCQSQCRSQVRALGRGLDDPQCGRQAGGRRCPNDLCCSQFGFCGDTDEYCKFGCQSQCRSQVRALGRGLGAPECGQQAGGRKCPNNLCCSQFGFCGDTDGFCGDACQSQCHSDGGLRASTGKASYYSTHVPSACYGNDENHFPRNLHMAAVSDGNPNLWKNGQGCGKQYRIRCQGNGCRNGDAITIKVVDRCPNGCHGRAFDLSEQAFGAIADKNAGVITVQYESVNCADAIPWAQEKLIAEVGRIGK